MIVRNSPNLLGFFRYLHNKYSVILLYGIVLWLAPRPKRKGVVKNGLGVLRRTDLDQCAEKITKQSHLRNFLFWGIGAGTILLYILVIITRWVGPMTQNDVDSNLFTDWPRQIYKANQ